MKNTLLAAVLLLAAPLAARAQALPAAAPVPAINPTAPSGDLTLGGLPRLIADKLLESKAIGLVDFAGHIGGGGYVPTYWFHDTAGRVYLDAADIGYRAIEKAKPSVFLMPFAVNITALSARAWDFQWARDHVTRSQYPDIFLGVGGLVPLDGAQVRQLTLKRPKDWVAACISVRR